MANTKDITDRAERKAAKRAQRKSLKETIGNLTVQERRQYRRSEIVGYKAFLADRDSGTE